MLLTDGCEELLRAGDAAGFKAGDPNGHCLQNPSTQQATILEVGTRDEKDAAYYSDVDMMAPAYGRPSLYTHGDGTPYTDIRRRGPKD
jgi:uncharacterized cupin superfamily protein